VARGFVGLDRADFPAMPRDLSGARALLRRIYDDAIERVRGQQLVEALGRPDGDLWRITHAGEVLDWPLPSNGRIIVVGAGKAAASMALGLESVLGDRIDRGCIIVKHGHREPLARIRQFEAGHPLPDAAGVAATRELLSTLDGLTEKDCAIVLLTGGASALMVAPAEGVTLEEKAAATDLLLRCGASIEDINRVRISLSRIKGGRLLDHIGPASVLTLLISDVPSGNAELIGSGPCLPSERRSGEALEILSRYSLRDAVAPSILACLAREDAPAMRYASGRRETLMLADSGTLLEAVSGVARCAGLDVRLFDTNFTGPTHEVARAMTTRLRATPRAARPSLLVAAGETTLRVTGKGSGGRNQEFALVSALALSGTEDVVLLAAGTDGTDGPTDAAGAFADGTLEARSHALGVDPVAMLARNDSYGLFQQTGDLLRTGPTGTNVMDLVLGLAF